MNHLERLGFVRYREISKYVLDQIERKSGYPLPSDYSEFLAYRPTAREPFAFGFMMGAKECEGQISEFQNIAPMNDDLTRLADVVRVSGEMALLPIGYDGAGNYLYLDLAAKGRVVDLDYETGTISPVADSFTQLLERLKVAD